MRGIRSGLAVLVLTFLLATPAIAQLKTTIHQHDFEVGDVLAVPANPSLRELLKLHQLHDDAPHSGTKSELLIFESPLQVQEQRLMIPVPNALVFDELVASLWVRSNRAGVRLGVRIRFPHQAHPETGIPLAVDLFGDSCAPSAHWQRLTCPVTDDRVRHRLIRARAQLASSGMNLLDERELYVDQLILSFQLPTGGSILQLDDLQFGPVVTPKNLVVEMTPRENVVPPALTISDDRLRKRGEPFFGLFTVYHGESLEDVRKTGVNMLWIPDYEDQALLTALRDIDIGAIAQPPMPGLEAVGLGRAALPTFSDSTAQVWAWMLGIDIPSEHRAYITALADQIRDADRKFRRPILADVSGSEREFHRRIDLMGCSRFGIHTALSTSEHFEQLRGRRDLSLPGKPMFTFVQTEASDALLDQRGPHDSIPVVEPEQILHQGYAAIAAGYKGIGFWKRIPLDTDLPGLKERTYAIQIFSWHCRLLEPWLASASVVDSIPVDTGGDLRDKTARSIPLTSRWDPKVDPVSHAEIAPGQNSHVRATILRTDFGLMILPLWNEPGSQYVPGPQVAKDARILVRGIGDIAQAWEVTPTSVGQSNLAISRVAGGTELHLRNFDQSSIIVITSRPSDADVLQRRVRMFRKEAAEAYVRLAELKLARVADVHRELQGLAPALPQADQWLRLATSDTELARQELARENPNEARIASQRAMQNLRSLQRAHWETATGSATSMVSSLAAVSFQTLPDHYRLLNEIGTARQISPNLLASGGFENEQDLRDSWKDHSPESRYASLLLTEGGPEGKMHLTMMVKPNAPRGTPAALVGPEIPVKAGQIVLITGEFSLPRDLSGIENDFNIYETLVGRTGALRYEERTNGWQAFRLIRPVTSDGVLRVRFELNGPGVVHLDDVRIRVVSPSEGRLTDNLAP
ncbi:hypothetical protein [Planctomicrobium sp. SH664]|uniref:hypothetical protein n=1 Tax=Planctomicrobium sp. SH664 TaxID=3448125 RepID=UPI003F5C3950